jgi:uncharacterized protein (TIGR02246 family)
MAGELEAALREMMAAFDKKDFTKVISMFTEDAQGVDELTRKWMRGRDAVNSYFSQFGPMMSDLKSVFSDVHEVFFSDAGVVTCWMEQDYKIAGEATHFSGPMTLVLGKEGGAWRIALVHAVPMPPA